MTATHAVSPPPGHLIGLWRRSLIAFPDGRRDTTTRVHWLQGRGGFVDIRRPAVMADFSHVEALVDLSMDDCIQLSAQQGFAGGLTYDGAHFEWNRLIDFQPKGPYADAGSLHWENSVLIERGRDVEYVEHWHLESSASEPIAAVTLLHATRDIKALLVRVGDHFAFARDRGSPLPSHKTLRECVGAAASVEEARALVDCEISFGKCVDGELRIGISTLPFRVGGSPDLGRDVTWGLIGGEGGATAQRELLSCFGPSTAGLLGDLQ